MARLGACTLAPLLAVAMGAQTALAACSEDAMIVFDGSASMAEISLEVTSPRITEARAAMARVLPRVEDVRRIGLLTYGPGPEGSCESIRLRFAPQPQAAAEAMAVLDRFTPAGLTPLTAAVERAAIVLDYRNRPAIVVLVTDGNETCGGRPCMTGERLAADGADLTIHVIGFRATRDFFTWNNPEALEVPNDSVARCLADKTGGLFVTTETEDALVEALLRTLGCPVVGGLPPAATRQAG